MIPLLAPGASVSAAHWNTLFERTDAVIAKCLNNRNLLYFNNIDFKQVLVQMTGTHFTSSGLAEWELGGVVGWVHVFAGAGTRWLTGNILDNNGAQMPAYDHSIFTAAAAGTITAYDVANKFVWVHVPTSQYALVGLRHALDDFFSGSLEAHKRLFTPPGGVEEEYYVISETTGPTRNQPVPLKRYDYTQAEIVFDAGYGATFDVLAAWNKHKRFWRFHNCQAVAVTVNFKGTSGSTVHSVLVPAFGSKCVRRADIDGPYTDGWKYLQRMLAGDYRLTNLGNTSEPLGFDNVVTRGITDKQAVSNNVVNPFIIQRYAKMFIERGQADAWVDRAGGALEDLTAADDAAALYAGKFQALDDSLLWAEMAHHAGKLIHVARDNTTGVVTTQEINFTKLSAAAAEFAAGGLSFSIDESLGVGRFKVWATDATKSHWLMPVSSNLVGNAVRQITSSPTFFSLPQIHTLAELRAYFGNPTTTTYNLGHSGGTASRQEHFSTLVQPSWGVVPLSTSTTLATARGILCNQPSTLLGDWSVKQFVLTGFGPRFLTSYEVAKFRPARNFSPVLARNMELSASGPVLVFRSGGFWIDERAFVGLNTAWPSLANPWFLTCRHTRKYHDMRDGGGALTPSSGTLPSKGWPLWPVGAAYWLAHECQSHEINPDGSDFTLNLKRRSRASEIAIQIVWLPPVAPYRDQSRVPVVPQPDPLDCAVRKVLEPGWWEANATRLAAGSFTIEDGGVTFGSTLVLYRYVRLLLDVTFYNNMASLVNAMKWCKPIDFSQFGIKLSGGTFWRLQPSTEGIYGTCRPRNQYCKLNSAGVEFCTLAGIPIQTIDDLPNRDLVGTARKVLTVAGVTGGEIVQRTQSAIHYSTTYNDRVDSYVFEAGNVAVLSATNGTNYTETEWKGAFGYVSAAAAGTASVVAAYSWVTIADVQAFAASIGYDVAVNDLGVPFRIDSIEYPSPVAPVAGGIDDDTLLPLTIQGSFSIFTEVTDPLEGDPNNPPPLFDVGDTVAFGALNLPSLSATIPWSLLAAIVDPDGEWVTSDFLSFKLGKNEPADDLVARHLVFTASGAAIPYSDLGAPSYTTKYTPPSPNTTYNAAALTLKVNAYVGLGLDELVRMNWLAGFAECTRPDLVPPATFSGSTLLTLGDYFGRWLVIRNYGGAGGSLLKLPVESFKFTSDDYSSQSTANLIARADGTYTLYPLATQAIPTGTADAVTSVALADGETLVENLSEDAFRAFYYLDGLSTA
jgi:hypothetical protein